MVYDCSQVITPVMLFSYTYIRTPAGARASISAVLLPTVPLDLRAIYTYIPQRSHLVAARITNHRNYYKPIE